MTNPDSIHHRTDKEIIEYYERHCIGYDYQKDPRAQDAAKRLGMLIPLVDRIHELEYRLKDTDRRMDVALERIEKLEGRLAAHKTLFP